LAGLRRLDNSVQRADNMIMIPTVEETVREFSRLVREARRKNNTPAKARAFLLRAGILEKHKSSPNGVRLAKRFR
jgi:hypothetical protein